MTTSSDLFLWRWSVTGTFTTGSAYQFLTFDGVDDRRLRHLWNIKIPQRVKLFLWLAVRNRLPTTDFLTKRGWTGPSICYLCNRAEEGLEHLLFNCSYSHLVWRRTLLGFQRACTTLLGGNGDLATRWTRARVAMDKSTRSAFDPCIAATCWELWKERNYRIFEERSTGPAVCGKNIANVITVWRSKLGVVDNLI